MLGADPSDDDIRDALSDVDRESVDVYVEVYRGRLRVDAVLAESPKERASREFQARRHVLPDDVTPPRRVEDFPGISTSEARVLRLSWRRERQVSRVVADLAVGTVFRRVYKGAVYVVRYLDGYVFCRGRAYPTLHSVAESIGGSSSYDRFAPSPKVASTFSTQRFFFRSSRVIIEAPK